MDELDKMLELASLLLDDMEFDESENNTYANSNSGSSSSKPSPPTPIKALRFKTTLVEQFRNMLQLISAIREDITFKANYDGITIKALDPAHIVFIKTQINPGFFDVYEIDGEEVIFALDLKELMKLLPRNLKGIEELMFSYSTDNPQIAKLTLSNYSSSKELTLSTALEPSNIPDVKVTWPTQSITISTKYIYRIIKQLPIETFRDSVIFVLDDSGLTINFRNDSTVIKNNISKYDPNVYEITCTEEVKVILSAEYLLKFLKYASKINDMIMLEIASNKPIKAILHGPSTQIEYLQAPRVEG